jgi:malate dehydrogenase (oxaloacetate-decarboxylating)
VRSECRWTARSELPSVLLQWEDFATPHALPILARYRDRLLTFNDDIQGTAAVAVGALVGAVHASGSRMRDQHVVLLGAGSEGIGVADMIRAQIVGDGLPETDARRRFDNVQATILIDRRRRIHRADRAEDGVKGRSPDHLSALEPHIVLGG